MNISRKNFLNNFDYEFFQSMSIKDQTHFMKRLSFLMKAGIPLLESLTMMQEQTRKDGHQRILRSLSDDVSKGQYLSTSLRRYQNIFGDFSINMIAFGESTGLLADNLEYLSEELRKKTVLRKKIIGAFIYPAIVTSATLAITGFLMIYLFPKIIPVFSSMRVKLPLTTRIVMAVSTFLTHHGIAFILGIILLLTVITLAVKKNPTCHFYFDKFILSLPIIGVIIKSYNLANFTRTLGLLLESGVTLSESLSIVEQVSSNIVYKQELTNLAKVVDRGEKMSVYFQTSQKLFPDVLSQIISVGERSGSLSKSLIYLSALYESEVDDFTKNLSNLIEPVLMIAMGVLVGFIAISIITPIYSITAHITPK